MDDDQIKNLDKLLAPKLGLTKKIVNLEINKLPAKGAGSVMFKVKVTVSDIEGKEEQLYLVAKKLPASELARKAFNIDSSFRKELVFYDIILPILDDFQKEENITDVLDNFAEFYGARYNLHGKSDIVDEDAVLLLEDLCVKGFDNINKEIGFDLNASEKVLRDIAKFHGTVIALKQKKPDIFETKVRPHCVPFNFMKIGPIRDIVLSMRDVIQTFPDCGHFADKAMIFMDRDTPTNGREPYTSLTHFDLWVNNIMNKIENGEVVKNIFVDFQIYGYRSVASDIFFFLWTSVQQKILEQHLDHLLFYYHSNLLKTLETFKIDISKFQYANFEEEIRLEMEFEFGHTLMFIFLMTVWTDLAIDANKEFKIEPKQIPTKTKERVHLMVTECIKRGWLNEDTGKSSSNMKLGSHY